MSLAAIRAAREAASLLPDCAPRRILLHLLGDLEEQEAKRATERTRSRRRRTTPPSMDATAVAEQLPLSSSDLQIEEKREGECERETQAPPESGVQLVAAQTSEDPDHSAGPAPLAGGGPSEGPALTLAVPSDDRRPQHPPAVPVPAVGCEGKDHVGLRPVAGAGAKEPALYDWRAAIDPLTRSRPGIDWDFARAKYDAWRSEKRHPDTLARWLRFAGNERAPPRQLSLEEARPCASPIRHWVQDDVAYAAARAAAVPMPDALKTIFRPLARGSPVCTSGPLVRNSAG